MNPNMCTLKGAVRDSDGKPVKGASLQALLGGTEPFVLVIDDGLFILESVKPGTHFIRVTAPGFMTSTQDVETIKGRVTDVVVQLEKGICEITGRITEDGGHPMKAEVTLLKSGIVIEKTWSTERSGTYHLRNLKEGYYEVQVTSLCHSAQAWGGNVSGRRVADLVLPVIDGCVVEAKCDVCGQAREVRYCGFCHAYICADCRHNYPERIKAMIRRRLSKKNRRPEVVDREYERLLAERQGCAGCF